MALEIRNLCYSYNRGTAEETKVLDNINLTVDNGEFAVISGPNGSGKTTLVKHLNGLLKPTSGSVLYNGKPVDVRTTGVLFQTPETQLFESTVLADVMFGPLNLGKTEKEAREIAIKMLEISGLGEKYHERDPFSLSNGEKRLAALAGVLAVSCSVLVLDEVTSGLDYESEKRVFSILKKLQRDGMTIVLVSHNPEHALLYCNRYFYIEKGHIVEGAKPVTDAELFSRRFADPNILALLKEHIKFLPEGSREI